MPLQAARREHTDVALHARSSPSGFSRGQASRLGGLRTDSRGSNGQPVASAEQLTIDVSPASTSAREARHDIRTVQELLDHADEHDDGSTHVLNRAV